MAYKNGRPVRMRDVADVTEAAENSKLGSWMNTTPAIILEVQRQPSANVISVVDNIKALLPTLEATLPGAVAGFGADRSHGDDPCFRQRRRV